MEAAHRPCARRPACRRRVRPCGRHGALLRTLDAAHARQRRAASAREGGEAAAGGEPAGAAAAGSGPSPAGAAGNFAALVRRHAAHVDAVRADGDELERGLEDQLRGFWQSRGVKDQGQLDRLVGMGAGAATGVLERALYRSTDGLSASMAALARLLPGAKLTELAWKDPQLLLMPPSEVAAALVALTAALPGVNVLKLVQRNPDLVSGRRGTQAGEAFQALRRCLPGADVVRMVYKEPAVLKLTPAQVEAGVEAARELHGGSCPSRWAAGNPGLLCKLAASAPSARGGGPPAPRRPGPAAREGAAGRA